MFFLSVLLRMAGLSIIQLTIFNEDCPKKVSRDAITGFKGCVLVSETSNGALCKQTRHTVTSFKQSRGPLTATWPARVSAKLPIADAISRIRNKGGRGDVDVCSCQLNESALCLSDHPPLSPPQRLPVLVRPQYPLLGKLTFNPESFGGRAGNSFRNCQKHSTIFATQIS